MNFLQELILALIQSLLEWLPVSSEGFIVLTAVNGFGESAEVALSIAIWFHLGTAIAVFIKYWRVYLDAFTKDRTILRLLVLSVVGTAIVGIPLYLLLKQTFLLINGMVVTLFIGIALAVTATLLRFGKLKNKETKTMENRDFKDEIGLGIIQGFAILPGISRSGSTFTYLALRGYKREDAFKISFLISLPAVAGAIIFDLFITIFVDGGTVVFGWEYLILMSIVAVIGFFAMEILLKVAERYSFDIICYFLSGITIILVIIYFIFI